MELFDLIARRHSVRAYKKDPIEQEKLQKIAEAACIAPTAANRQPFKVYFVPVQDNEAQLARVYRREWFAQGPWVICVSAFAGGAWVRSDGRNYGDVDAAIVMDHIILAATELGLGTCWIGNFDLAAAKELIGAEEGEEPLLFTPLGYPADGAFSKIRKPLDEKVKFL